MAVAQTRATYTSVVQNFFTNIGNTFLAFIYFVFMFSCVIISPVLWLGYPFVILVYWLAPNNTTTTWFAPWFFFMDVNYASWKYTVGFNANFWGVLDVTYYDGTCGWDCANLNNILWNLTYIWLLFPFWIVVDLTFFLLWVPIALI